jgi:hypothetical protein
MRSPTLASGRRKSANGMFLGTPLEPRSEMPLFLVCMNGPTVALKLAD